MTWFLWAIILLLQQGSATWVSRARNSRNLKYHAIAAIGSNGVWFLSQVVVIGKVTDALRSHNYPLLAFTAVFYAFFCVTGSVSMHHFLMTKVETGTRACTV